MRGIFSLLAAHCLFIPAYFCCNRICAVKEVVPVPMAGKSRSGKIVSIIEFITDILVIVYAILKFWK
ncbi:hypothetical protein J2T14_004600 [Paenibacillus harenae]|nr:hypothetical protein [Paenibacillus harenae]